MTTTYHFVDTYRHIPKIFMHVKVSDISNVYIGISLAFQLIANPDQTFLYLYAIYLSASI